MAFRLRSCYLPLKSLQRNLRPLPIARPSPNYNVHQLRSFHRARQAPPSRTIRIPPLPLVFIGVALTCLGVGLYEYLTSDIQKYPPPVRQALRKALYYQQDGKDKQLSVKYFKEALELALDSPELERDGAPLTGIMIQFGVLLESLGRLPEARQMLLLALRHLVGLANDETTQIDDDAIFQVNLESLPPLTQKKVAGIAQKLGDITAIMRRDDEAEKWYTWSVEHLLRISSRPVSAYGDSEHVVFDKEHMPEWLTGAEIGGAMEALAGFYAARNKYIYSARLYLEALSLAGFQTCRSTVLMNNLSESFAGLGKFDDALKWAREGLELAQNPNTRKANKDGEICDTTCGVLLYNMGMILEQTNKKSQAMEFYERAREHGRRFKSVECIQQADRAIRRLKAENSREK